MRAAYGPARHLLPPLERRRPSTTSGQVPALSEGSLLRGFSHSNRANKADAAETSSFNSFPVGDKKSLRGFLGTGSNYRRLINNYERLTAPLQRRVPDAAVLVWGEEQEAAFNPVKDTLVRMTQ